MSAAVLLAGPPISLEQGVELLRAIAPTLLERPIVLREAGREVQPDMDGRSACWSGRWVDGDVELVASVSNGDGNPRDGYGYNLSAKLLASFEGRPWWRAELYGGGWDPALSSPIRLGLLGVSPTAFDAIRARALEVLPTHRDVTFDDPYATRDVLDEFERGGHTEWLRTFLARPLLPHLPWMSAHLCELKVALRGPDTETARTWATIYPAQTLAWAALADAGGDAQTSEGDARWLAALTHPFSARSIEAAALAHPVEASALAAAMAHVFLDPSWRWLDPLDRDAFEARRDDWRAAESSRVEWERAGRVSSAAIDLELATLLGLRDAPKLEGSAIVTGPPIAGTGGLGVGCGLGPHHSVRRAILTLDEVPSRSDAVAVCHTNAEDRLACFGLAWLDAQRQVIWRSVLREIDGTFVRSPILIDVIDTGDGAWGAELAATLRASATRR
ncbi:MAG: hypothetical protein K1X94_19165 [Sandaracinaceae bacterium]|nr:hypothetical protein [Sandaracinaceae bacterium]